MRFKRFEKITDDRDPKRQAARVKQTQRKERESAPLFAGDIAAIQPDVDTEVEKNRKAWGENQRQHRDRIAKSWRKARASVASITDDSRRALIRKVWDSAPYPGMPEYLLSMLHSITEGRWSPEKPPWVLTPEEIADGRAKIEAYWKRQREEKAKA